MAAQAIESTQRPPIDTHMSRLVFAVAFVVLVPFAIWVYTLVFAFSALWFAHFCLAALQSLRAEAPPAAPPAGPPPPPPLEPPSVVALPDAKY